MGLEPTTFGTTIRRADQLHHIHHIYFTNPISQIRTSPGGFEPSTYGLEGRCSIQLSYGLIFLKSRFRASRKRVMGIEPTYPAWKAGVLPLNYTRKIIGVTGFEPATSWSQTRRSSQTEPHPDMLFNYVNRLTPLLLYSIVFYLSTTFFKFL